MNEFFEMGGHGIYIWPCYGLAAALLIALLVASIQSLSKSKKDLSMMEQLSNQESEV
ncbi:heme exporter protein CcmD [Terasakiella sp. A23]|uniref:heme exporter protein CcmD n=1 Tax=Terasakiella sp. FCG-A23 TaxID=3080561 RepID=UPI002952FF66|nr:heme exporter protein CcmD [Terasakiella sp. A23]MDV7339649.1 heme exporter protein CcmD [Terasakiella sp. A23]